MKKTFFAFFAAWFIISCSSQKVEVNLPDPIDYVSAQSLFSEQSLEVADMSILAWVCTDSSHLLTDIRKDQKSFILADLELKISILKKEKVDSLNYLLIWTEKNGALWVKY